MRLRRIELVVIGLTLAFAVFMGGFFTGRSWNAVNVVSVSAQNEESQSSGLHMQVHESPTPDVSKSMENSSNSEVRENSEIMPPSTVQEQQPISSDETTSEPIGVPSYGDGKININLASQSELTDLPGIGSTLASRIVDYRRQHGDFSRIEDIRNVSGIGEKRYDAIQDMITVG
ncbi:MAG: helix-hairpin-helix domain-containing protein [Oscillospiraceae bacterium]|nr:helix-hairpin-helix domain-containing protein [Oscillospiraceae bacterium]